ncbi:hypothetical protein ACJ69_11245 [Enterobacter asburiae]|nr:hypothetical protein ACJ69_11245 [Enterobacter asburiae]
MAAGDDSRLNTVDKKTGGNVSGSLMVTQGNSIGVSTQEGGDKAVKLYNITGDGTVGSYVNAVGGPGITETGLLVAFGEAGLI